MAYEPLYSHLCCILNSLLLGGLVRLQKHKRSVHCFGSHFVHNNQANVASLSRREIPWSADSSTDLLTEWIISSSLTEHYSFQLRKHSLKNVKHAVNHVTRSARFSSNCENRTNFQKAPSDRRGGLMVSALESGASGPGSSFGRGHCVVFLGETLFCHSTFSPPRCINRYRRT